MEPEKTEEKQVSEYQCGMCGLDGGPVESCQICQGAPRLRERRTFTLTEERQGLNPDAKKRRYGPTGDVNPRIVVLPGGLDPSQGKG